MTKKRAMFTQKPFAAAAVALLLMFLAFTARDERKVFDVFVVSPETGKIERITQDQGRTNEEPTWAPSGRLLAFKTDRRGGSQLVISDPRGDRQTPVAGGVGELSAPAWGPFPE